MKNKKIFRQDVAHKASAIGIMAVLLCCLSVNAEADFSYIQISPYKTTKLSNPLYLDTSRTVKPKIKTITPYNGEFNEADYFSSKIDESELPPEEFPVNNSEPNIKNVNNTELNEFSQEKYTTTENSNGNNFFAPPNESTTIESPEEIQITNLDDNNLFAASANTEDNTELEGKLISHIYFEGLKRVDKECILNQMKTQIGSLFNEEILQEDLQRIYSIGFFTENMSIEPEINQKGSIDLKFILEENIPVTDVSIVGNTVISSMELMPFVTPLKDMPQNISHINNAIDKINNYYHSKGYILAGVSSVDDSSDGNLIFSVSEGIIGKILIEGNEKTKDYVITRNIMTQPGTVYNENYLKEDLSRIYSTKIFKEVNREIYPSETNEGEYNVKVVVEEDSPNSLSLGGGIDNGLGAFGSVSYSENNFLGKGQKLTLSGILGSGILLSDASIKNRMNYQLELSFFEPHFLNADNSLMSKLYYRDFGSWQVPLAIERRFGINTTVEHKVKGYNNLSTNFSAGIEHISLSEGDFDKISQLYALRNLNIADRAKELTGGFFVNLAPGVKYSTLDSEEIPRNGIVASAKFIEALSLSDFQNTNGRLAGSVTKYFPVRKKSSFSLTARGGVKVHGDEMPEVMAFRLGGPYSIRGFRMSGVGSGDAFIMGSAELATPLPLVDRLKWDFLQRIRLTFFVDAGKVFDPTISSILYDRPMSAITAGIGLRLYIPGVGPVSVDYGIPITNPGEYGSRGGYFTFGTGSMNMYNGW